MKLFGLTIKVDSALRDGEFRIVRGPVELTEPELRQALAVPMTHPVLRSVLQLIDQLEDEAIDAAAEDIHLGKDVTAVHIGGGKYLRALRDGILQRVPAAKAPVKQRDPEPSA